jgi:hypothetical protein
LAPACGADAEDFLAVVSRVKVVLGGYSVLQAFHFLVHELENRAAGGADQVVVVIAAL